MIRDDTIKLARPVPPAQPEQEPSQWRDMVVVNLVREGINKHKARELADHFATAAQPEQEPVAWMVKLGDVTCFQHHADSKHASVPLYTAPPAAQWDKPSASFNEWWDSDVMPTANPFVEGTAAYWAWSGWKAAQPEQEPTCPKCKAAVLYECVACSSNNYPPAAQPEQEPVAFINPPGPITQYRIPTQRQWVGLTDEEITEIYEMGLGVRASIETALDKLEERNT